MCGEKSAWKTEKNHDLPLTGLDERLSPRPLSGVSAFVSEGAVRPAGITTGQPKSSGDKWPSRGNGGHAGRGEPVRLDAKGGSSEKG